MKIGIDLGTSYSSVAAEVNGKIEMIRVSTGASAFGDSFSMPTAVYMDNGHVLLGQAALSKRKLSPSSFKSEFKRDFGTTTPYIIDGEEYLPEQLYTELLMYFKTQAVKQTGEKVERVYITHPANYGNNKKRLIEKAANNAGLFDVVLVDEPTAAAAGYAKKNKIIDGDILLVYDLGGGTFDAALIKKTAKGYIHLTEPLGISQCGGIDFDRVIFEDIIHKMTQSGGFDIGRVMNEKRFIAALSEISIQIKHQLSQTESHTESIAVGFDYFEYTITRQEFESMIRPLVSNTCEKVKDILKNSGLMASDIDRVLLVGGSSRVPLVQRMVGETLKKEVCFDADPELAICQGALCLGTEEHPHNIKDAEREDNPAAEELKENHQSEKNESIEYSPDSEYGCNLGIDIGEDEITVGILDKHAPRTLYKIDAWDILTSMNVYGDTLDNIHKSLGIERNTFGEKHLSSCDIYENIFKEIKRMSESCLGRPVNYIMVTTPVGFTYFQKTALVDTAERSGLQIKKLTTQTAATAARYGYNNKGDKIIIAVNVKSSAIEAAVCDSGYDVIDVIQYMHIQEINTGILSIKSIFEKIIKCIKDYDVESESLPYIIHVSSKGMNIPLLRKWINETCTILFKQRQYEIVFEDIDIIKNLSVIAPFGDMLIIDSTYYNYIAEINGKKQVVSEAPHSLPTRGTASFNVKNGNTDSCRVRIYISDSNSEEEILCEEFNFEMVKYKTKPHMEMELQLWIDTLEDVRLEIYDKDSKDDQDSKYIFKRVLKGKAVSHSF